MGAILTYFYYGKNEPDPVTGLTPKNVYSIKSTWNLLRKDLPTVGIKLFLLFFKDFPQYQNYFPFKDVQYDKLKENKVFRAHANSVAYAFSSVVENVDNIDILVPTLQKIGDSHAPRINIQTKSFDDLKETVLKLLKAALESKFSTEVEDAWKKALDVAFKVIVDEINENRTSK